MAKATDAEKAVTKLGKQRDLRKAVGEARDGLKRPNRGIVYGLDGTAR